MNVFFLKIWWIEREIMYKKVYVEVTNNCNLSCDFCIGNKRDKKIISIDEFIIILDKLKDYTKYLYLHVMGEPLMHPRINELIDMAFSSYYVNITTNGYLIDRIKSKNIRQINISLHSYDEKYGVLLTDYMNSIFSVVDKLPNTYVSYRLWVSNINTDKIISLLEKHYNTKIDVGDSIKIKDKVFISFNKSFVWPSFDNEINNSVGTCYALRDHIGILVDGSVVPCCLDSGGEIVFGNIYKDDLDNIVNSTRYLKMLNGFNNNIKCEELCKKCDFL